MFERWPWEPGPLKTSVTLVVVLPAVLAGVLYPFVGTWALLLLTATFMGLVFRLVYGIVGKKVEKLARSAREGHPDVEAVHALIVNGNIQSPGVVVLKEDEIILEPIVGKRVVVSVDEIESLREAYWFNGKLLPGKVGFWLSVPGRKRLGVAVSREHAGVWRSRFRGVR